MRRILLSSCLLSLCLILIGTPLWAQGVLIEPDSSLRLPRPLPPHPVPIVEPRIPPQPVTQYEIQSIKIEGTIQNQVAQIQVSQVFKNTGDRTIQAQFLFPLPYDAAIDSLTLLVDGKEFSGALLSAEEAKKRYQEIVRKNQDPAWLQWIGSGLYQTSVFPIPSGATRTVTITYSQLLRQTDSLTDFLFPLATARYSEKAVQELNINLNIKCQAELKSIYSPTHEIKIERPDDKTARIQVSLKDLTPKEDFRLFFNQQHGLVGASLISTRKSADSDGYFMLLANPGAEVKQGEPIPKTVIFLIDTSGSMSGEKMKQAQAAAKQFVERLNDHDLFNLIVFNSKVDVFLPELEIVNAENRTAAIQFIEGQFAGGATNISDALATGLGQLKDQSRPAYVLLLTDGQPTAGQTNEGRLAAEARELNKIKARMLVFGLGYDVNSRLLDRLSRDNRGQSEYVRENESIELAVSRVINRINRPVLTENTLTWEKESGEKLQVNRIYPSEGFDLFLGEQLVIVGRYKDSGPAKVTWRGKAQSEALEFTLNTNFAEASQDTSLSFVPRLWAMRRIGELIDELDLNGKNDELVKELVQLSTEHGILTPYTSFLADDSVRPDVASAENLGRTESRLSLLDASSGSLGFGQRALKSQFRNSQLPAASGHAELDSFGIDSLGSSATPASPRGAPNFGGRTRGPVSRPANTTLAQTDTESESVKPQREIFTRHGVTFYQHGQVLVTPETSTIDLEKDTSAYKKIKRNSDEYFELITQNSPQENALLSEQPESMQMLIKIRGQVYLFE